MSVLIGIMMTKVNETKTRSIFKGITARTIEVLVDTVIISLLGIGNNIFVLPMLKKLKMSLPYNDIDILLGSKNILDIYQGFSFLSNIYHLPDIKLKNFFKFLKLMFYLRKKKI